MSGVDVNGEVKQLVEEIKRLGKPGPDGQVRVNFVDLIDDDKCSNTFEAIMSTLRAGRKSKVLTFEGELLLKGAHDDVPIILLNQ